MRTFTSYGPLNTEQNYFAPREALIQKVYSRLMGENPEDNGYYITVWAPRQTGKTWVMQEVVKKIKSSGNFDVVMFSMETLKHQESDKILLKNFVRELSLFTGKTFPIINDWDDLPSLFTKKYFKQPLVLILDEFDSLEEKFINRFAGALRGIYVSRAGQVDKTTGEKAYVLHGAALIGVQSVLGIGNEKGSPFNIQRSVHIPNLTFDEVDYIFKRYQKESGQQIDQEVIGQIYYECNGQPGLTCWLGELLTETYNKDKTRAISMDDWRYTYLYATRALPNNNVLNMISKANTEPYKEKVLELFRTDEKIEFRFDDGALNFLYLNGVIDIEENREEVNLYSRFSCPFVQKRLFNHFANELFGNLGELVPPFESLGDAVADESLNIANILRRYQTYLNENRERLLEDAPRRKDLRVFEAVYHFSLFRYLYDLLKAWKSTVYPEFPTGNGKIDILIRHAGKLYGLELKTFTNEKGYRDALEQTARYGRQLGLLEISLVFFVEAIDQQSKQKFESEYVDETGDQKVVVKPLFIQVGK